MKERLDRLLHVKGLVATRSQAESWIKLGKVYVDGKQVTKPGAFTSPDAQLELKASEQYVSRAGLKLASVARILHLDFADKVMLDVGSSTGGFTDYALQHGIRKVIAVDVGTDQLHPTLLGNHKIELHEQTDIRDMHFANKGADPAGRATPAELPAAVRAVTSSPVTRNSAVIYDALDIVVIDVSFVSLRDILPHVAKLSSKSTVIAAMVKPQFEARESNLKHKGVIKNDKMRREILKDFEAWAAQYFVIVDKADSDVAGTKGNRERFYKLHKLA